MSHYMILLLHLANEIQSLAKKDPRIELHFNISNEELNDLYTKCQFCVYPSLFEGFGIPILEAFSYGKARKQLYSYCYIIYLTIFK